MKKLMYIIVLGIMMGACSSVKVTSDYDKSADFTQYKTYTYYGWADNSDQLLTGFDKQRIEDAFRDEFAKRGWTSVPSGGDAIISLYIVIDKKTSYTSYTDHYNTGVYGGAYMPRYGYGYRMGPGMGTSTTTTKQRDYNVGTLIVDVFDAKEKKHIWHGVGTKTINENTSKREERIREGAAAIMEAFPVQPKQ